MPLREWTIEGFLRHFKEMHEVQRERRFCFVLGAGASVSSGIPAAGTLVRRWIEELHQAEDPQAAHRAPEGWATEQAMGIAGFEYARAAEFYAAVFERRFEGDPVAGYSYLERLMEGKAPSFGYSVLAQILAETRHNVVITTNFDNLVADALATYSAKVPLVCGHESLAPFARAHLSRPLVAKIHRDLLLAPVNDTRGVATLADGWAAALDRLFEVYAPLVIGYGGNDGSLMGYLDRLPPGRMPGRLIWFYVARFGRPNAQVLALLDKHAGVLVPVEGFDELMFRLALVLGYPPQQERLEEQARRRVEQYSLELRRLEKEIQGQTAPPLPPAAPPPPAPPSAPAPVSPPGGPAPARAPAPAPEPAPAPAAPLERTDDLLLSLGQLEESSVEKEFFEGKVGVGPSLGGVSRKRGSANRLEREGEALPGLVPDGGLGGLAASFKEWSYSNKKVRR